MTAYSFDPVDLARRERPRLFMLAARILEAYHCAKRPRDPALGPKLGGFESWDELVRGCVAWCGFGDCLAKRADLLADSDADMDLAIKVLDAWNRAFPMTSTTVAEALKSADEGLRDAFAELTDGRDDKLRPRVLGAFLRKYRDRIVGRSPDLFRLRQDGKQHSAALWIVDRMEGGAA
jgi:hypothetical protein